MNETTTHPRVEQIRNEQRLHELKSFLKVCSGRLSMPLFLLFWLADLTYAPERKWEFLGLRLLMVPVCLLTHHFISKETEIFKAQIIGSVYTFFNSLVINYMILVTQGITSPYYAGLNLVFVGIISFVPWTPRFLAINSAIIFAPYFVIGLAKFSVESLYHSILNLFFISGTVIISLVIRHFSEKLRSQDAKLKHQLQCEIENRQEIIERQTKEAVKLKELTTQFSPQIVHAIQNGKLNIYRPIHETRVCAIFIDIVNSTEKVIAIDKIKLNKVISTFLDDTMSILLKYDITIDKFLGDGILAFSNDPIEQSNYVDRVVNAAIEIVQKIEDNSVFYEENWGEHLELHIGIAAGNAHVGFYGNEATLKSYTAIGRVVNLASRLCSKSKPNQILISKNVKDSLKASNYQISPLGDMILKGFQAGGVEVYSVEPYEYEKRKIDVKHCPHGHGILHLDANAEGHFVFACRTCGYEYNENDQPEVSESA